MTPIRDPTLRVSAVGRLAMMRIPVAPGAGFEGAPSLAFPYNAPGSVKLGAGEANFVLRATH